MAVSFKNTRGTAQRSTADYLKINDGENTVRLFGDILPRYVYWLKNSEGKNIAVECLAFDREQEKFTRAEVDPVREMYPEAKCSWAYLVQCLTPAGEVKVFALKKKLFLAIQEVAETLGDPTDPETGWDVIFKRVKTGSSNFNVEYSLQQLKLKARPLTANERAAIATAKSLEELFPRPTPDEITKALANLSMESGGADAGASEAAKDI